ncbi:hypothetical protein ACVIJ6_000613 [Bradyrhizobium sp. USDA 4369]
MRPRPAPTLSGQDLQETDRNMHVLWKMLARLEPDLTPGGPDRAARPEGDGYPMIQERNVAAFATTWIVNPVGTMRSVVAVKETI